MKSRAEAIRELRGVWRTQDEFSDAVGVSRVTVSRWERGEDVRLEHLQRLVSMGLDPAYLLPPPSIGPEPPGDVSVDGDGEAA